MYNYIVNYGDNIMNNIKKILANTISITDLSKNVSSTFSSLDDGIKIVIRNNKPEGVIMSTKDYIDLLDTIEDLQDALLAQQRMSQTDKLLSEEEVWKDLDFTKDDLDDVEVEFE